MSGYEPRVDAYIAKSAEFAQPILKRLREVVHAACPDVEETLKWSTPHFVYRGDLCAMAAFRQHATFGFHKGSLVVGEDSRRGEAMGQFGRIVALADLPPKKALSALVKRAMALNEQGVPRPKTKSGTPKPPPTMPADFAAALALKKHAKARATFEGFAPSQRREYTEWIADAKREETRARRLAQALEWLAEGKARHWKYAPR